MGFGWLARFVCFDVCVAGVSMHGLNVVCLLGGCLLHVPLSTSIIVIYSYLFLKFYYFGFIWVLWFAGAILGCVRRFGSWGWVLVFCGVCFRCFVGV